MTTSWLVLALTALVLGVQTDRGPLASKVRLSLAADEQTFFQRAPVAFSVVVHNLTDERMTVGLVLKPVESKYVELLYRPLSKEFRPLSYAPEQDIPTPRHPDFSYLTIDARQHQRVSLSVAADPGRNAFVFDEPGEYEIKMICHVVWYRPRDTLETAPLRIRVAPAPPSEAAALEDWDVYLAIFAQNDGSWGAGPRFRRSLSRALQFMDAHPTSLYSELLRARSLETLEILRREGKELTELEREGYERLKRKPVQ